MHNHFKVAFHIEVQDGTTKMNNGMILKEKMSLNFQFIQNFRKKSSF